MDTFANRLSAALKARHMTASELSKMTGIGDGTISNYKKGRYEPKQKILNKIAKALDVSISFLMGADVPIGRYEFSEDNKYSITDSVSEFGERESFLLDTYRKADLSQKMRIERLAMEILDEIEKNSSASHGESEVC